MTNEAEKGQNATEGETMEVDHAWLVRAEEGDGQYAIAIALLRVAAAIDRLGNADAATPMGAIEGLAAHLGEKVDNLASSIQSIAEAIDGK